MRQLRCNVQYAGRVLGVSGSGEGQGLYLTQSLQEKDNVILSLKKEKDAITPKKEEAITPITPKKQEEKIFDV